MLWKSDSGFRFICTIGFCINANKTIQKVKNCDLQNILILGVNTIRLKQMFKRQYILLTEGLTIASVCNCN